MADEQVRLALAESWQGGLSGIPPATLAKLAALRLVTTTPDGLRLTRRGMLLGYNLHEFYTQVDSAAELAKRLRLKKSSRILDLGCGAGQTLALLPAPRVDLAVGVDCDTTALSFVSAIQTCSANHATAVAADVERLPFKADAFDRVICRVLLMFVHVPTVVREISRVTASGGLVYLHLTDFRFYWRRLFRLHWENGGVLFALFNGLLLHLAGVQFRARRGRSMNYQTLHATIRELRRNNFSVVAVYPQPKQSGLQKKILARKLP